MMLAPQCQRVSLVQLVMAQQHTAWWHRLWNHLLKAPRAVRKLSELLICQGSGCAHCDHICSESNVKTRACCCRHGLGLASYEVSAHSAWSKLISLTFEPDELVLANTPHAFQPQASSCI